MRVAIIEICRRPEVRKADTEALALSSCLYKLHIPYELISNDGIWAHRAEHGTVSRAVLRRMLRDPHIDVVHFALHGSEDGLVLRWDGPINDRTAKDVLAETEIRKLRGFRNRLVVSGACSSAALAPAFLAAGATACVAPKEDIPWGSLAQFFRSFYSSLAKGWSPDKALATAIKGRSELKSFEVFR